MTYMREICVKFPKEFGKGPVIALLEIYLKTKMQIRDWAGVLCVVLCGEICRSHEQCP